ncbi:MAG TPA: hypothetical protein PLY23_02655, partial [Alphaproteobacteria bacterium]|nr:hypothetical protein [Alphaproteobacteria bacterium]HQS93580.1 hypothetical protein [Alphaproteobacteria bacterium]
GGIAIHYRLITRRYGEDTSFSNFFSVSDKKTINRNLRFSVVPTSHKDPILSSGTSSIAKTSFSKILLIHSTLLHK